VNDHQTNAYIIIYAVWKGEFYERGWSFMKLHARMTYY